MTGRFDESHRSEIGRCRTQSGPPKRAALGEAGLKEPRASSVAPSLKARRALDIEPDPVPADRTQTDLSCACRPWHFTLRARTRRPSLCGQVTTQSVPCSRIDRGVTEIPVISGQAVLEAIDPRTAIERTRDAFERYGRGDWEMPAKVYLDSPPYGDFRAMPARGDGLALLKWVTSFPGNSARGLPVVRGEVLLSDAETGEELAVIECSSVTSLRTGAAAAVSAQVLALDEASSVGIIGCGVNGAWSARCLAAAGYGDGVCADVRARGGEGAGRRARLAGRRSRGGRGPGRGGHGDSRDRAGDPRERAASRASTSPCSAPTPTASRRSSSRRSSAAGSSATSGSRRAPAVSSRTAVEAGVVDRDDVTQLGDVLIGSSTWTRGRRRDHAVRLDRSRDPGSGDLPGGLRALAEGGVEAPVVSL